MKKIPVLLSETTDKNIQLFSPRHSKTDPASGISYLYALSNTLGPREPRHLVKHTQTDLEALWGHDMNAGLRAA